MVLLGLSIVKIIADINDWTVLYTFSNNSKLILN